MILLIGSVVADYPYYTDYNNYNLVYTPATASNISSRLHGIKRTWNPDGPFTFGLSEQLFVRILWPNVEFWKKTIAKNVRGIVCLHYNWQKLGRTQSPRRTGW